MPVAVIEKEKVYRYMWVKNKGKSDYQETVNGTEYVIKAGEKIKMRRREAIALRGSFPGDKVEKKLTLTPCFDDEAINDTKSST
jgi:hypothetical protein